MLVYQRVIITQPSFINYTWDIVMMVNHQPTMVKINQLY